MPLAAAAAALGGRLQAGVAQISGVGEPGGVAADEPGLPALVLVAGHELLDLGVVEMLLDALRRSSANTSAKSPPWRNAVCKVRWSTDSSIKSPPTGVVYRRPMSLRPGLSAAVELVVTDGDTAARGRGPVTCPCSRRLRLSRWPRKRR